MKYNANNPNGKNPTPVTNDNLVYGLYYYLDGTEYEGMAIKIGTAYYSYINEQQGFRVYPVPIFSEKVKPELCIEYINIAGFNSLDYNSPIEKVTPIREQDYEVGIFNRYFITRRNYVNTKIYEIDEKQFKTLREVTGGLDNNLYYGIIVPWKITGPINDIIENGKIKTYGIQDTNRRTILLWDKTMKGLKYKVTNFLEFSRITTL